MRVARLIIYQGPEDKMLKQLGMSSPDGEREFNGMRMSVVTLPSGFIEILIMAALVKPEPIETEVCRDAD